MSQTSVLWGCSWREDPGHALNWLPGSGSAWSSLGDAKTQRQGRRWGGQIREGMNEFHEEQLHFLLTCPPTLSSVKLFWAGPKSQWPLCFSPKTLKDVPYGREVIAHGRLVGNEVIAHGRLVGNDWVT